MKKNKKLKPKFQFDSVEDIFYCQNELDYHDLGPLTNYDIEKILNEFLEDSYIAMHKYVRVITGKGQVVRPYVQKLLKTNKYVEKFKTAGYFGGQDGAIEITLKSKVK